MLSSTDPLMNPTFLPARNISTYKPKVFSAYRNVKLPDPSRISIAIGAPRQGEQCVATQKPGSADRRVAEEKRTWNAVRPSELECGRALPVRFTTAVL
jgi:hypothetical protein